MNTPLNIVHLEDNEMDASLVEAVLQTEQIECRITRIFGRLEFRNALCQEGIDLILSDFSMPRFDGLSALEIARKQRPEVPFIFVSGTIGEELAIQALQEGATDYVLKDRMSRLPTAIKRALMETQIRRERQQAEEALRESLERLARAETFSHIMVTHAALDGRWLKVPPQLCAALGYSEAELLALNVQDVIHPHDAEADRARRRELLETGQKTFSAETRYQAKDGGMRWMSVNTTLVADSTDSPVHFLTYLRDITQRMLAQEKVRAQAELLNLTSDAILICDLTGKIGYWNKGAEALYGCKSDEAMGKNIGQFVYSGDDSTACFEQTLSQGKWNGELTRTVHPSQHLTMQSRWSLMRDEKGSPESILIVDTDITEKKRLEAEFLRQQRVQTVGAMAGGIAHDLKNSLTPVVMGISLLRQESISPDGMRMLDVMAKSAEHGTAMVNQILSFARGLGGSRVSVNVSELIEEMVRLAKKTFPSAIEIRTRIASDLHPINGNLTQLHQALLNLFINARDAMAQGGSLAIDAANVVLDEAGLPANWGLSAGSYVSVQVTDTGHGIPKELLDKIFEPFFTTKQLGKGTGLGLSTVLGIIKTHGGGLQVESDVNRGTTFRVYLPAVVNGQGSSNGFETPRQVRGGMNDFFSNAHSPRN